MRSFIGNENEEEEGETLLIGILKYHYNDYVICNSITGVGVI